YYVTFKILINKKVDEAMQVQEQVLSDYLNLRIKKSLSEVHSLAENSKIKEVYISLKKEVGDLSKVTEGNKEIFIKYGRMLRVEADPIIEGIQKETGEKLHIHFHLPGPRSFVRMAKKSGEDIKLDDLSSFRFSVAQAQREKKVVTGIEPGRDGIILRAIAPIVVSGEVLGSVEAGENLNELMQNYVKGREDQIRYIIFVKKDLEKIMDFYLKEGKGKLLGDWILVGKSNNLGEDVAKKVMTNQKKEDIEISGVHYHKIPIKTYTGEEIGYIALGYDVSKFTSLIKWLFLGLIGMSLVYILLFLFVVNRGIKGCLVNLMLTTRALEDLAKGKGDLSFRLDVRSEDEIGMLSKHFNAFMDSMGNIIKGIMEKTKALFSESEKLKGEMDTLNEKGVDFKERADFISLSSSELLSAMEDIARSMQELSSAINEISKRALESSSVVKETVGTVNAAKEKVELLQKASQEINEVVNLINSIAEQTNLLALNASIEAARAGEAGKGFAVVANEVKELARQTQGATSSIAEKIRFLQESSNEVSSGVESIVEQIAKVEESANAIASAVEEQTIVVNSVSEHIMTTKDKIMINEDQANVIKNAAEEIVSIAERLRELSIRMTDEAKAIEELISQFKL
ncbi:MAG: methyl-accepting chemotaxis protein, partial [Caldimicrobium sp.]